MTRTGTIHKLMLMILLGLAVVVFASQALAQGNSWETKAPMPTARSAPMAAAIGGLLYVVGGHNGTRDVPTLEVYDPTTDTWRTLAPLPIVDSGNAGRYQGAVGVIDGKLYLPGGWRTSPPLPTNTLLVYDPATNTWSRKADLPILSGCSAAGVIARRLYVLTACDGFSGYRKFLHVYNPDTNTWTSGPEAPNIHAEPAAGVIEGKLYVVGGFDGTSRTGTVDVYDPGTNRWETTLKAPMPTARMSLAGGVIDRKLYVVGGSAGGPPLATLEVYNPATNTWTTEPPLPTARASLAGGVIDRKLYAVGGSAGGPPLATLEVYHPERVPIIQFFAVWASNEPGFTRPGFHLSVRVDDPDGQVPLTIQSVIVTDPNGLIFDLSNRFHYPNLGFRGSYALGASPITIPTGTYTVAVTDTRGNTVTATDALNAFPSLLPPTITSLTNEQILTTITPTFQWTAVTNAVSTRVFINNADGFQTCGDRLYSGPFLSGTVTQFALPSGVLEPGRRYCLSIEAYDSSNGLPGANIQALRSQNFSVAGPNVGLFLRDQNNQPRSAFHTGDTLHLGVNVRNDRPTPVPVKVLLWVGLPDSPPLLLQSFDYAIPPTAPDISTVVNDLFVYTFTGGEHTGDYVFRMGLESTGLVAQSMIAFSFSP